MDNGCYVNVLNWARSFYTRRITCKYVYNSNIIGLLVFGVSLVQTTAKDTMRRDKDNACKLVILQDILSKGSSYVSTFNNNQALGRIKKTANEAFYLLGKSINLESFVNKEDQKWKYTKSPRYIFFSYQIFLH